MGGFEPAEFGSLGSVKTSFFGTAVVVGGDGVEAPTRETTVRKKGGHHSIFCERVRPCMYI